MGGFLIFDKGVKLVGGGSVINGAYPTEGRASYLFPSPSLSKVLGNIISEPEHKPLA